MIKQKQAAARVASMCLLIPALVGVAACSEQKQASPTPASAPVTEPVIQTYQGDLSGAPSDILSHISVFRGIPYAAPPVGARRWQPPQAPASWSGTKATTEFGAACPQPTGEEQFVWSRDHFTTSEDCLYLNIWSDLNQTDKPVMVWFHGGAHTGGKAHDKIFDGSQLAARGVVLVSVNYRLGALGFLAHPALSAESSHASSGNYGLLDKIAALNWVRDNIAQFGGDPANVTIFGQSAGSQSVCSLMASPLAKGMFHKAIGQSASCLNPQSTRDLNGHERGSALVDALGTGADLSKMRNASVDAIMEAADNTGWANQSRIVIDGWVLPEPQMDTFSRGQQAQIPILVGSLANEGEQLFPVNETLTEDALKQSLGRMFSDDQINRLLNLYSNDVQRSPGLAQREINTDLFMAYGMRRWAALQANTNQPAYLYFMDHNPPAFRLYNPGNPDLKLPQGPRSAGAYHSGDLAYVFGTTTIVGHDWQPDDHKLSTTIMDYWTNFAKTGNPNGDGLPEWPRYSANEHATMLFDSTAHASSGARSAQLSIFAEVFES